MKKVLIITVLPIWSMEGKSGGKALFSTVDYYSKNGFEVYLMTDKKNDLKEFNIKEENIFYVNTSFFEKKMQLRKIGLLFKYLYVQYLKYMFMKEFKKIKDNNFLIYGYEVEGVMVSKKIASKYKLPLITRFQGTIMSQYHNNFINKIRHYPHLQALSIPSDLVIMTNDGTQGDRVLKECNNKSKTLFIRNGVNILDNKINFNKKEFEPNNIKMITVSRLENWKKVDRAIYALKELNDTRYHLTIVGEGSDKKRLINLTKELKVDSQITFTGAIPNAEVYKYMIEADIFLSFYDLSNVGNPLLEALCLGKMIITYNVGDTNKIINNENGILLDDVEPHKIASCIKKLDKKTIKEYERKAKKYADENLYSWKKRMEIEIKEIEGIYNEYYNK